VVSALAFSCLVTLSTRRLVWKGKTTVVTFQLQDTTTHTHILSHCTFTCLFLSQSIDQTTYSTGLPNRIQVSHTTAELLIAAGKESWLKRREDSVMAKGKGVLNTYWVVPPHDVKSGKVPTMALVDDEIDVSTPPVSSTKTPKDILKRTRLINWVVEVLSNRMKEVLAKRYAAQYNYTNAQTDSMQVRSGLALDEVVEVIQLSNFDQRTAFASDASNIKIDLVVMEQLTRFVSIIASAYRENPFHNFEHACHVTMAVDKFMKRIVAPDLDIEIKGKKASRGQVASQIHDYTHGITSDPLALLAIVFSALIHDVDHRGVSNVQLCKEEEQMATLYRHKSVAEQNSLDLSWSLLMMDEFDQLRHCMFDGQESEIRRFRQIVVNVVLATDIFDKELNDLRKGRWNKAFHAEEKPVVANFNGLRATIVIEHIIQASDVAHTMQHWHVYRKWNKRLFQEMYMAFRQDRMGADPSTFWYKGELGFFDNYVIPLAKKLKDCNVFGVSSDECLNYALQNRAEWEVRGEDVVKEIMSEMAVAFGDKESIWRV
jgi:3'5'-cyclic nucleotide phosphodiesterase